MNKNKKIIALTAIFACCLGVSSVTANYVFSKSDSKSTSGNVDVKDRSYSDEKADLSVITLKSGYENGSCVVQGANGVELTTDDVQNFFVATNEDGTSALDVTDSKGNHFVKLNRYYVNMSQDGTITTYKLSKTKVDDTYFVCPYFMLGTDEVEYAYYGKYKGSVSGGYLRSDKDATPLVSTSIDQCRAKAVQYGGFKQFITDWTAVFTAQIMYMCYFKSVNAGGSDVSILGIEHLVGQILEYVDGIQYSYTYTSSSNFSSEISWFENNYNYYSEFVNSDAEDREYMINHGTYAYSSVSLRDYGISIEVANYCVMSKIYSDNHTAFLSLFPGSFYPDFSLSVYYHTKLSNWSDTHDSNPKVIVWGTPSIIYNYNGVFFLDCFANWKSTNTEVGTRLHVKSLTY